MNDNSYTSLRQRSDDADLFGPAPHEDALAYYAPQSPGGDFYTAAAPDVRAAWHDLARGFANRCNGDLGAMQNYLDRHVEDLGLAFRITGEENERPWPLGPMPILVAGDEWETVTKGLIQRADLLETVIADLYGEQSLVTGGHLPAGVVSGSNDFARRMVRMAPQGGYFLNTYAVDLARGPTGEWRVLADRVRFPVGIGITAKYKTFFRGVFHARRCNAGFGGACLNKQFPKKIDSSCGHHITCNVCADQGPDITSIADIRYHDLPLAMVPVYFRGIYTFGSDRYHFRNI